jgi:hypothetical protein
MNCRQISSNLSAYLDHELSTGEERQLVDHINTCEACRLELAELRKTRRAAKSTMQWMAESAEPSAQAWADLQHRINQQKGSSTKTKFAWLSNLAPGWLVNAIQTIGASQMSRRFAVVVSGALIFGVLGFFMMEKTVTPVSAKQILDRAYEVQMKVNKATGISHMKVERFTNPQANEGNNAGTKVLSEDFTDYQTGNYRKVEYLLPEMKVIHVEGYDGKFTYSSEYLDRTSVEKPLTVYRSPQSRDKLTILNESASTVSAEEMFNLMRRNSNIAVDTDNDASKVKSVYVLITDHDTERLFSKAAGMNAEFIGGTFRERMVFDSKTYQLLETETTVNKGGKKAVIKSTRYLVDEVLPAEAKITWDMSDLKGVSFVDDLDRSKGDLLPEKITPEELVKNTDTGYLLNEIPEGFDLTITAPPRQAKGSAYIYVASYLNKNDDYFVIQNTGDSPEDMKDESDETYKTKNGLTATFMKEPENLPDEKTYQSAVIRIGETAGFLINSSLPRERVKQLMEDLIVVK